MRKRLKILIRPPFKITFIFALTLILSFFYPALANEKISFWEKYRQLAERELEKLKALDLWGATTVQLPKGYFSFWYEHGWIRVRDRFDANWKRSPVFPTIIFPDPLGRPEPFFRFDVNARARAGGRSVHLGYGITDFVNFYFDFPFQFQDTTMTPDFKPGTCDEPLPDWIPPEWRRVLEKYLPMSTEEDLYRLMIGLGRNPPNLRYKTPGWILADCHSGVSWNYLKKEHICLAMTGRIFFPTAKIADPDNSFFFFTGAQVDADDRAWGLGLTHSLDFRFPKPFNFLIIGQELTGEYKFKTRRPSPHFPKPDPELIALLDQFGFESDMFPDLSDMPRHYYLKPDPNLTFNFGLGIYLVFINYGYFHSWKPQYISSDPGFEKMIDAFGLIGESTQQTLQFGINLPLWYYYIPTFIQISYQTPIKGKNAIIFDDYVRVKAQFYLPTDILKKQQ